MHALIVITVLFTSQSIHASEKVSVYWSGFDGYSQELRGESKISWDLFKPNDRSNRRKREAEEGVIYIRSDFVSLDVQLEPKNDLVGPWTKMEWVDDLDVNKTLKTEFQCHYSGKVIDYSSSLVAMSGCNGISGYIAVNNTDYILKPFTTTDGEWFYRLDIEKSLIPKLIPLSNDQDYPEDITSSRNKRSAIDEEEGELDQSESFEESLVLDDVLPIASQKVIDNQSKHRFEFSDIATGEQIDMLGHMKWEGHPVDKPWEIVRPKNKPTKTKKKSTKAYKDPPKWIETTLAVDSTVIKFHGHDKVLSYVLTLMNIVGAIYQEETLQANIKFVLIKIVFYANRKDGQVKQGHPKKSLDNVNKWSYEMHLKETDDYKHDLAIWLTRHDIGGPAGYAPVSGICDPKRSGTLNRDEGFTSAFILAHEIGHVLGLSHDGDHKNGNTCDDDAGIGSVMAPMVAATFSHFFWSSCSTWQYHTAAKNWKCLLDRPTALNATYIESTITTRYSMDEQCTLEFGLGFKICEAFHDIDPCSYLWCSHVDSPGYCKTKKNPPLEGTTCGKDKWCVKGTCQSIFMSGYPDLRNRIPQDGGWSDWTNFTSCSRTCGGGAKVRYRTCDEPRPLYGGKDCEGPDEEFEICHPQPCGRVMDLREEQCQSHPRVRQGQTLIPYESETDNPCRLICQDKDTAEVIDTGDFVIDGTFCTYDDPSGICIQGKCYNIGCDGLINSTKIPNKCGICTSGDDVCYNVIQRHTEVPREVFTHVTILPRGARRIKIQEMSSTPSTLALKFSDREEFLMRKSNSRRSFVGLGTRFHHQVKNNVDSVTAHGPILDDILLMIEAYEFGKPVEVLTNYTIPKDTTLDPVSPDVMRFYRWKFVGWKPCSRKCGGGVRTRRTSCYDVINLSFVPAYYCHKSPNIDMTPEPCNTQRCEYKWALGEWEHCSQTCGTKGRQHREIFCLFENYTMSLDSKLTLTQVRMIGDYLVDPILCPSPPPITSRRCNNDLCPGVWISNGWTECSQTCGSGLKIEKYICHSNTSEPVDCGPPPQMNQVTCNHGECPLPCQDLTPYCQLSIMARYCLIPEYTTVCCKSCRTIGSLNPKSV